MNRFHRYNETDNFFTGILTTLKNVNICLLTSFWKVSLVVKAQRDITDVFCPTFFMPLSH